MSVIIITTSTDGDVHTMSQTHLTASTRFVEDDAAHAIRRSQRFLKHAIQFLDD